MISRHPRRIVALLATVLLLASGCGDDGDATPADDAADPGSSTAGDPSPSAAADLTYVALGDSYTSAPLVPETDPGDPCLRSSNNYPAQVAAALPEYALTDVSCAGADSTAMVGVQQIGSELNLPQFDSLSEDTDLVTVGLGGNEFGLFSSLLADCASSSDLGDAGSPCTDATQDGSTEDLAELMPQLTSRITAVLTGIRDRAPDAEILAVGYPRLVPDSGTCDALPVAAGDYAYVRDLDVGLNTAVEAAARAADATFVDVYTASQGHDICSADPWVNGKDTDPAAALGYHPFASEQQAVAEMIVAALAD